MKITEVRVKRLSERSDRLRAFCSITIDDEFVVHDLRVIEGRKGLFVAMPSRKLTDNCPKCSQKNHLRAKYCNNCGTELDDKRAKRRKFHVDVAHPIVTDCRDKIMQAVLDAYNDECDECDESIENNSRNDDNKQDDHDYDDEYDYDDFDDEDSDEDENETNETQDQTHQDQPESDNDIHDGDNDGSDENQQEQSDSRGGFGDGIL